MTHDIGIADEQFIRGNVPMTKKEVRMMVLTMARIKRNDVVIDIGAGTGSYSVEAALMAPDGMVYAIEKNAEAVRLIEANLKKFNVNNVKLVSGAAPRCLVALPKANVIIIGGSGGAIDVILDESCKLLADGGRIIITAVTVETLYKSLDIMQKKKEFSVEALGIQITRISKIGSMNMQQAINPVHIVVCTKEQ